MQYFQQHDSFLADSFRQTGFETSSASMKPGCPVSDRGIW